MAQIIENVYHPAGTSVTYAVPVGKKIYGFIGISIIDIDIDADGVKNVLLSNTGFRMYMFPAPIEFKASTVLTFRGNANATVGVIRDE